MDQRPDVREMLRYASVGLEFLLAFGLGVAAGLWLDARTGAGWVWTVVGAGVGFAAGMYRLVRVATEYRRRMEGKDRRP